MTAPRFETDRIAVGDIALFAAVGGAGPALCLLHGYPQTHAMWGRIAADLARDFTVVLLDLPGYGRSDAPAAGAERYSKRAMAADVRAAMQRLGHSQFALAGHDRGGRVAYRLALDSPASVRALSVLDIVPTGAVWENFSVERAMKYYHWLFLAQPEPLPEAMIGRDPLDFLHRTLSRWSGTQDLSPFADRALKDYESAFCDPARIAASCMDYRAGATLDWAHDRETRAAGTRIACPVQVLWGSRFDAGGGASPLDVWRDWADALEGGSVDAGHFLCDEAPQETGALLRAFLERTA